MANAFVEKVKRFGLRHGEKVVVGLAGAAAVVLIVLGGSRPTIDVTPDQIKKSAEAANQNISRPQSTESIVELLDGQELVPVDFAAKIDAAEKKEGPKYVFTGPAWLSQEPGAGLIRDTPALLAPTELFATSGRGALQLFERDDQGNLVYEEAKKDAPKSTVGRPRSRNRNRGYGSGSSSSGGMMAGGYGSSGGMPGMPVPGQPLTPEQKKQAAREAARKAQLFVGQAKDDTAKEDEEIAAKAEQGQKPKETTRGYRWVAVVGTLDHQALKDNYVKALKDTAAQPHYLRLDIQRQELDGEQWTDWADVDRSIADQVFNNLTEIDEELANEDVRLEGIVDPLPFLKIGYYRGVHVASLVPKDKRETQEQPTFAMGMAGGYSSMGMMGSSGYGGDSSMSSMGMSSMGGMAGMGSGSGMMEMGSGGMMMGGYGGGMPGGGPVEDTNFPKTEAPTIMVRTLDFTVEPDKAYRYRLRVVVKNPNLNWETVAPGVDTTAEELPGPWSEATDPVRVPADVTTYAVRPAPSNRADDVEFQVARWDPATGVTVVKTFTYAPGQIVGEVSSAAIPKDNGEGRTSKNIDFVSRQLLVDAQGGPRSLTSVGANATLESPALALVQRPDGVLILRDQARDASDPEARELREIYDRTLKDADAGGKKPPAAMGGYGSSSGMMGSGSGMPGGS
jgi:hypothetical protein